LLALVGWRYGEVVRHAGTDFVDFEALHGRRLLNEVPDSRLNAWILAWVQHSVLADPASLGGRVYDTNLFHPTPNDLTGSEHLFGIAAQMLPLRLLTTNAIALHQLALVWSAALFALFSFYAVLWFCAPAAGAPDAPEDSRTRARELSAVWAAFAAGAFALFMPWRVTELSHLQLSSAHFLPLVWALLLRGLAGQARTRHYVVLGIATALQLLSSFYLAYYLTISCAVIVGVVAIARRPALRDLLRLGAAAAPGYLLLGLSAIPYLQRQAEADLASHYDPAFSIGIVGALAGIAPRWPGSSARAAGDALLNAPANYWTPWAVALLAAVAIVAAIARIDPDRSERDAARRRDATFALLAVVVTSVVLMIGGTQHFFGVDLPMPGLWLSHVIPGFSMLRGPTRWGILAGASLPLLAGLGVYVVDRLARGRLVARVLLAGAAGATLAPFSIPTRAAWRDPELVVARAERINALEAGPLLEIPWTSGPGNAELGSRNALASTLTWRPVLNGYTGHRPATYRFLQRIGERLPGPLAIERLQRLTGLRFIEVDARDLRPKDAARWRAAAGRGWLRQLHADADTLLFEIPPAQHSGDLQERLLSREPGVTTLSGLARRPLDLPDDAGRLDATIAPFHHPRVFNRSLVRIQNRSDVAWPGFDIHPDGLVELRYSYIASDGRTKTRLAPLDVDVPAHETVATLALLQGPRQGGTYTLCLDMVQHAGDGLRVLPVPAL